MSIVRIAPELRRIEFLMRHFDPFPVTAFPTFDYFGRTPTTAMTPPLDMVETKDGIEVRTELPGLKKEDIKLEVDHRQLVISGESKQEKESEEHNWRVRERSYGRYERRLMLPEDVDVNKVSASYQDGILSVKVAKLPEEQKQHKAIAIE